MPCVFDPISSSDNRKGAIFFTTGDSDGATGLGVPFFTGFGVLNEKNTYTITFLHLSGKHSLSGTESFHGKRQLRFLEYIFCYLCALLYSLMFNKINCLL